MVQCRRKVSEGDLAHAQLSLLRSLHESFPAWRNSLVYVHIQDDVKRVLRIRKHDGAALLTELDRKMDFEEMTVDSTWSALFGDTSLESVRAAGTAQLALTCTWKKHWRMSEFREVIQARYKTREDEQSNWLEIIGDRAPGRATFKEIDVWKRVDKENGFAAGNICHEIDWADAKHIFQLRDHLLGQADPSSNAEHPLQAVAPEEGGPKSEEAERSGLGALTLKEELRKSLTTSLELSEALKTMSFASLHPA